MIVQILENLTDFYSRPRVGGDITRMTTMRKPKPFLLTPPRGGRLKEITFTERGFTNFYSRPRVGGDASMTMAQILANVFLLTPPRGGRRGLIWDNRGFKSFISTHAPAWGATRRTRRRIRPTPNFYSRPRVGGDMGLTPCDKCVHYFYSRPRVGGDRISRTSKDTQSLFLLTPPRGGRLTKE